MTRRSPGPAGPAPRCSFTAHRASIPSPAVQAAAHVPPGATVGYEMSLWPHATALLRGHPLYRIDASFARPDPSLYILTNGVSDLPGTQTFAWENTDAY